MVDKALRPGENIAMASQLTFAGLQNLAVSNTPIATRFGTMPMLRSVAKIWGVRVGEALGMKPRGRMEIEMLRERGAFNKNSLAHTAQTEGLEGRTGKLAKAVLKATGRLPPHGGSPQNQQLLFPEKSTDLRKGAL